MGEWVRGAAIAGMTGVAVLASFTPEAIQGQTRMVPPALAIVQMDYIDTSGEVRDQQADHMRRLKAFTESLRRDLAANGILRVVALDCSPSDCPASSSPPDKVAAVARKAGAAYVLVGGIHKTSTLIQWAKVEILDVGQQKVVFDRLLTFRGDNDTSWQRAEEFLARDILEDPALK
jgi:TolB-like protein